MTRLQKKITATLLIILSSVLFYTYSSIPLPVLDERANAYFEETLKASTIAYAATRGVNAVVSVLKESQIEVSPVGVGINIAAGQILDPIDDMTERLSSVIVASIVSIGIQKIGYEIGQAISFKIMSVIILFFIPLVWLNFKGKDYLLCIGLKACFILLLLRLLLPMSSMVNDIFYQKVLKGSMDKSLQGLSIVSSNYEDISSLEKEKKQGFFSSIAGSAQEKVEKTKKAFLQVVDNIEKIISSLLELTTMYVAMFVIQILVLPLLMLWLVVKIVDSPLINNLVGSAGLFRQSQAT